MLYYENSSKQDAEWFGSCNNNISLNIKEKPKCLILNP